MAHAHRSTALPHPGTQITTRDIYSPATPAFRRPTDHQSRSPSIPGSIRRQLSPTPSPHLGFTTPLRMDPAYGQAKSQQNIPPLMAMHCHGSLHYMDGTAAGTPVKLEINGSIDKGFFLADNEWTCYRRNYFSCICSYNLTPHYPNSQLQYTHTAQNGTQTTYSVIGFAMSISAVVADNDGHAIELVQHTPKRDKGPTAKPDKVQLQPKPAHAPQHHGLNLYGQADSGLPGPSRFDQGYGQTQQNSLPTEHTFERIQFKQATANNGKRRAAQQYYHLVIELWADVGSQSPERYIKVASRKSAKMIVRGRSPGHYQAERRGSASSGPGGSAGSLGYGGSQVVGSDFGSTSSTMMGTYGSYDPRPANHYGTHSRPHQDSIMDPAMSAEEVKSITEPKDYQYYPAPIFAGSHDPRGNVEMFSHHRSEQGSPAPSIGSGLDMPSRVKQEYEGTLPSLFFPGNSFYTNKCGRFEGKSTSSGFYPTVMAPPPSAVNMT